MADEVFNKLEFFGGRSVKTQIEKWKKALASYKATKDDPFCARAIQEVFYQDSAEDPDYGSKWVHPVAEGREILTCESDEIALQSAWNIPIELVKHIAGKLSEIDKNVVVKVTAESGSQLSTAFAATNKEGEIFCFSNDIDIDASDQEYADALDEAYGDFDNLQYDTVRQLVDNVQNVAPTLQEHFKPALLVKRFRNDDNDEYYKSRVGMVWAVCPCGSGREYLLCCGSDELSNPMMPPFHDDRIDQIMQEENLSITDAFNVLMERMGYADDRNTSIKISVQQESIADSGAQPATCNSCGESLKINAKFCGNCGAKIDLKPEAQPLVFAPNPLGLDKCEIKILEVKSEGPDSDGDIRIEIKYEVTNKSNEDWDYLVARTQVLNANGLPLEETRDTYEQSIAAGDTGEFETYLSSIKFKSLGGHPNQIKVLVNLVACGTRLQKIGEFAVPANPFEMLPLVPFKLGDTLQMVSGNLWKTGPDSDKDSTVNVKTLIQNLTPMHLHEVAVIAEITDKSGRDITNANGSEEVRPGDVCLVSGYGYGKDKQFKGAKISLALRAYFPQATGLCEHTGMEVSTPEVVDTEEQEDVLDDEADSSVRDQDEPQNDSSTRLFYANMKWFEVADQPDDIDDLPEAFGKAQLLWEKDKKGNLPKVLELLSGYVGARFLPSNLNDWEELFVDPDGGAMPEFEARQVRIVGIDFSTSPIPLCKAEAVFEVEVTDQFAGTDLDDWQDSNSQLSDAVTFYWNIPDYAATEDLDLTSGDNQGVECVCVDRDPFDESAESSAKSGQTNWKINAGWEVRKGDKAICRWFICWKEIGGGQIVGALAGFSGGGSFEVERFYGKLKKEKLTSLWIDFTDRVSDEEIDFSDLGEEIEGLCESALDQVWEWNDHNLFGDTDEVVLLKDMKDRTTVEEDMLLYATSGAAFLREICGYAGLTAAPSEKVARRYFPGA